MKRRNFLKHIKTSTICGLTLPLTGLTSSSNKFKKITILHTNDVHSHIDPFPENDPINPNSGGVVARSNLINFIKKGNPNTLVLDAGDVFQGTPYFNFFEGEVELKLMSKMGYNASTLGNHEFDNGIEKLAKSLKHANFSFLNSNYTFKNTALENKISKYKIFNVDGIKIGVFGLGIQLEALVDPKMYGNTAYEPAVKTAKKVSNYLRHEKECNLIICLSHLGLKYETNQVSDMVLAEHCSEIDIILGGHTHDFIESPIEIQSKNGQNGFHEYPVIP